MSTVVVVDLEGVAGVDDPRALFAGSPGHEQAIALAAREVQHVVSSVRGAGEEVGLIFDTHRGGGPSRLAETLPELEVQATEVSDLLDALAAADSAVFVGMHAPAGCRGFAPHTHDLISRWFVDGRPMSEVELWLAVCRAHQTGVFGVGGDSGLGEHLEGSKVEVPFVVSKFVDDSGRLRLRSTEEVFGDWTRVIQEGPREASVIRLRRFELAWPRRWPALQEGLREGRSIHVSMFDDSVEALIRDAVTCADRINEEALRAFGQVRAFEDDVQIALQEAATASCDVASYHRPDPLFPKVEAPVLERLRDAFLRATAGDDEMKVALRGLVLHMLEQVDPKAIEKLELGAAQRETHEQLWAISAELPAGLDPDRLIARVDAAFLTQAGPVLDPEEVEARVRDLIAHDDLLYAYVLSETAHLAGVDPGVRLWGRMLQGQDVLQDLYWVTHQIMFDTGFFARMPEPGSHGHRIELLRLAAPWLQAQGAVDLAAEAAICLCTLSEWATAEPLVRFVLDQVQEDGRVMDAPSIEGHEDRADHTIGAALVMAAVADAIH